MPNETKNLSNSQIANCKFIWTNDGVNKLTGVLFVEKETGETTKVNFD